MQATSTETANNSSASITRSFTVQQLDGNACATPAGVNPYVSYLNNTAVTTTSGGNTSFVASPLVPVTNSCAIVVPGMSSDKCDDPTDSDKSMEEWMQGLSQSISSAFLKEMERGLKGK